MVRLTGVGARLAQGRGEHSTLGDTSACGIADKVLAHRRFWPVCAGRSMPPARDEGAA